MRISTVGYSARQGIKNIGRNKMFSVASIATMCACIFLFGLFFSIVLNFSFILKNIETNVGITVFFEEGLPQDQINRIGQELLNQVDVVKECNYISADEAWASFADRYFDGNEVAAEGFKDNKDNPLANSAHYEVYVYQIEQQNELVSQIRSMPGVRDVKQSEQASKALTAVNKMVATISVIVIAVLLVVSVFLIGNTVAMGIAVRREEIAIMKYIGATNAFIRLPFFLEGIIIGFIGAAIPLVALYFLYQKAVEYILHRFSVIGDFMNGLMPVNQVFIILIPVGLILGMLIGFIGSSITIRKHLNV